MRLFMDGEGDIRLIKFMVNYLIIVFLNIKLSSVEFRDVFRWGREVVDMALQL